MPARISPRALSGTGLFAGPLRASPRVKPTAATYGVPLLAGDRVVLYNKDMFAKAGVSPPTSLDELIQAVADISWRRISGRALLKRKRAAA